MDNEKRVLLAIILSIAVLFLYQSFLAPPAPQKPPEKGPAEYQPPQEMPKPAITPKAAQRKLSITSMPQTPEAVSDTTPKQVTVKTQMFSAVFSSREAALQSFRLHNYKEKLASPAIIRFVNKLISADSSDESTDNEQMFKELVHIQQPQPLPLLASFLNTNGNPAAHTSWHTDKDQLLLEDTRPEGTLTFTRTDPQGLTLQKEFVFNDGEYKIDFNFTVSNASETQLEGNPFIEWTAPYPAGNGGGFFSMNTQNISRFAYFIKNKVKKKELQKIEKNITLEGDILWTAIEQKYFTSAIISNGQKPVQVLLGKAGEQTFAYQLVYPFVSLQPGEQKTYSLSLYLGPRDIDILKAQGARLEKTIDFGVFDVLAKPLLLTVKFFYSFLGNYGLAIILLTIIIKILFWPLSHKSMQSMKDMQKIQPELAKLKEKYKNNKEEFARQQMAMYKKYKVNPLGGCLPMLLQIPVFIALYRALMDSIELRHANFISFWINDLSAKDPTYIAPIIMGLSMLLQQKMTPSTADPAQAKMMMFMPIIFTVMFLNFPSGLVIYWLVNNVLSIAQQLYINKKSHQSGGSECNQSKSKQKVSKKQS